MCEENGGQFLLPFDFWEKEAEAQREIFNRKIAALKTYKSPKNDNQLLFNLQKAHYTGDRTALGQIFMVLVKIAARLVNIETHKRKRLRFTSERIDELSVDAAAMVIEQIRKNNLMIETSFIAYLRLQVLKVMFSQTESEKFERFCVRNRIDLFSLDANERFLVKRRFEQIKSGS